MTEVLIESPNALKGQFIRDTGNLRIYKITGIEKHGVQVHETEGMHLPKVPRHDDSIDFVTWAALRHSFTILVQAQEIKGVGHD